MRTILLSAPPEILRRHIGDSCPAQSPPAPLPSRAAFTFVELVLVLTLVLALASIILPIVYRMGVSGKAVLCSANLSQLGKWAAVYAGGNESYLPNYENGWVVKLAGQGQVPVYPDNAPANELACPSQPFVGLGGLSPAETWRGTNYGINQHIASALKDANGKQSPYWVHLATRQIKDPASKLVLADSSGSNYFGLKDLDPTIAGISRFGRTYVDGMPPIPAQPFPFHRHQNSTANFAYLDGHVAPVGQWPPFMQGPGTYGYTLWSAEPSQDLLIGDGAASAQ